MTRKFLVRQGGGGAAEVDFLAIATPRKGAPFFDADTPLWQMGQRFANGEAAMGYCKIVDPAAEFSSTGFRMRPWAEVRLTEDASGDELTLGWMRVSAHDASRRAPYTGADQVEHDPQFMDCNLDLRGIPFRNGWDRPAETDWERLQALQLVKLNGAASTGPIHRVTTDITVERYSNGHLVEVSTQTDLPAVDYPEGTEVTEIISDIAEQSGKIWGVVLHHDGGSTHKCLLYVDQDDITTYTTDVRISDQLADHDPDGDPPTFAPHWLMGAGRESNMEDVISGLISIYGGTNDEPRTVYVETGEDDDDWETFVGVYNDAKPGGDVPVTRRANWILNDRKRPYNTHKVSILVTAEQAHLVEAGMAIETKSVVMEPGPNKHNWMWRRVAEKTIEPVADGRYWLHLHLERPRHTHGAGGGAGQPKSTTPKPAPEPNPNPGDSVVKFYNANDAGGDAENWTGNLANQSPGGANGTTFYNFKSNAPNKHQTTWAVTAGSQYRVSGYINSSSTGRMLLTFTSLAAGSVGAGVAGAVLAEYVLSPVQPGSGNTWTLFSAGPFTAPVGTNSAALGRTSAISWDETTVYLVGDPTESDEQAVDYDGYPHDSPFFLPSDYVEARLDELEADAAHIIDDLEDVDTTTVEPDDGDVLTWDDATEQWVPLAPSASSGSPTRVSELETHHRFIIVAHQGDINDTDGYPEGTLEAIRQAVIKGAHWVDLDLRKSSDGTWHILHDSTLDRTTNLSGAISGKTDAAIAAGHIDGGNGYNAGRHGTTLKVPTLLQVVDALKQYPCVFQFDCKILDDSTAAELAQFAVDEGIDQRVAFNLDTDPRRAIVSAISPSIFIGGPDYGTADWDDTIIDTFAEIVAFAPTWIIGVVPRDDYPSADEAAILETLWDRGARGITANDIPAAVAKLYELENATHLDDTADAHDASAVSETTDGDVQTALDNLRSDIASGAGGGEAHAHIVDEQFSGDASTTVFILANEAQPETAIAYVAGTRTSVTVGGTMNDEITFDSAPASGTNNVSVDYVAVAT